MFIPKTSELNFAATQIFRPKYCNYDLNKPVFTELMITLKNICRNANRNEIINYIIPRFSRLSKTVIALKIVILYTYIFFLKFCI